MDDSSYNEARLADALSQGSPTISENNIDDNDNSWGNVMKKSLGFDKSQKCSLRFDVLNRKLKKESFWLTNSVQGDLILIDNWFSLLKNTNNYWHLVENDKDKRSYTTFRVWSRYIFH